MLQNGRILVSPSVREVWKLSCWVIRASSDWFLLRRRIDGYPLLRFWKDQRREVLT